MAAGKAQSNGLMKKRRKFQKLFRNDYVNQFSIGTRRYERRLVSFFSKFNVFSKGMCYNLNTLVREPNPV